MEQKNNLITSESVKSVIKLSLHRLSQQWAFYLDAEFLWSWCLWNNTGLKIFLQLPLGKVKAIKGWPEEKEGEKNKQAEKSY